MTHSITDHGELDYLTPKPSEVDKAIARAIRVMISDRTETIIKHSVQQQLMRNGLSPSADPFAWLRGDQP